MAALKKKKKMADVAGAFVKPKSIEDFHAGTTPEERQTIVTSRQKSEPDTEKTKATFYISTEVIEKLEDIWFDLRRNQGLKVSKSQIVDAAITCAVENQSELLKRLKKE